MKPTITNLKAKAVKQTKPNLPDRVYPKKPKNKTYHAKVQKQTHHIKSLEPSQPNQTKQTRETNIWYDSKTITVANTLISWVRYAFDNVSFIRNKHETTFGWIFIT